MRYIESMPREDPREIRHSELFGISPPNAKGVIRRPDHHVLDVPKCTST
jgi:hypothetical protein